MESLELFECKLLEQFVRVTQARSLHCELEKKHRVRVDDMRVETTRKYAYTINRMPELSDAVKNTRCLGEEPKNIDSFTRGNQQAIAL